MFEREEHERVAVLRLAHGKANALDLELLLGLTRELEREASSEARALVLTGSGSIFSAGVDLLRIADGGPTYVRDFLPALDRALGALFRFEKPVVAAINGHAVAGGCVLACACDVRLMTHGKGRIGVPELLVGVPFPALALELVRRVVPPHHLDETVLAGRMSTPDEALARGLVDELCDPVLPRAVERAQALAAVPPRSFALTKRALRLPHEDYLARHGQEHDRAVLAAWTSDEVRAAIRAYVQKTLKK